MMRAATVLFALGLALVAVSPRAEAASGHVEGYLPAAAHGPGRFGSFWTTDVWIYRQEATVIHLWFNAEGENGTDGQSVVVPLDRPVVDIRDIVASLFGTEGVGSVHYLADGPVSVVSRTWTSAAGGGGYGQTIAGAPVGAASFADGGQGGALRMLVDQRPGGRANLGVVNVSPVALTAAVEIFTADGQPAPGDSSFTVELAPFAMEQVNDVLARIGAGERSGLIVRVGVSSADGAVLAYLSEVDNVTNDASYQEGFRFGF